ncbi:MAG: tetratricopeptide repeat protein [Treponema sp.]|jgi:tetratricopeptide (TPR) repeat protein|nr:tetratricopeptide repeat protein [Treponema sp.]
MMGELVFLSIPHSLRASLEHKHHHDDELFIIDPAIPIPVDEANIENLSTEALLSGMIRFLMEKTERTSPYTTYYRHFVRAVRPSILAEFTEAAIIKARNADYAMALEIIAALEALFPASEVVLLNKALVLEERAVSLEQSEQNAEAAWDEALEAYEKALAIRPPFPDAFFNAGFFFIKQKNFTQARHCFNEYLAITVKHNDSEDDDELKEKQKRAKASLRKIDKYKLDDALFQEAYNAVRADKAQEALPSIHAFLERNSEVWNGWFLLGWALRKLKRWDDGVASFQKAIELGGDNADTRNELAICLMETQDYTGARKQLEIALRREPENVKIISNLGVLALRRGDDDEATGFFRTVLEIEPDDPMARNYFSHY